MPSWKKINNYRGTVGFFPRVIAGRQHSVKYGADTTGTKKPLIIKHHRHSSAHSGGGLYFSYLNRKQLKHIFQFERRRLGLFNFK